MGSLLQNTNIVIVNYNGKEITSNCINSLIDNDFPAANIIVTDNASSDDSVNFLKNKYPRITIVSNSNNNGYAAAINSGASKASKKYLILSNNDVIYKRNSLLNLIKYLEEHSDTGAAGPQQIFPDGSWQRSSGILPLPRNRYKEMLLYSAIIDFFRKINYKYKFINFSYEDEYIDGAVIAVKKDVFEKLNGFDSKNYFFYSEEADFCYRISRLGLKNVIVPKSEVIHLRGASSKEIRINNKAIEMLINSKMIFLNKYFSSDEIKKYINSIIINHKIYIFIWKMLEKTGIINKNIIQNKLEYFTNSLNIWQTNPKNS